MNNNMVGQALACRTARQAIFGLVMASCIASCTSYFPSKLAVSRVADTLSVALAGDGEARWDPEKDSLIVECKDCTPGRSIAVVHFENRNYARFEVDRAESLRLKLRSMGRDTVVTIGGEGAIVAGASPELLRLPPRDEYDYIVAADVETAFGKVKTTPKKEPVAPEKPVKKTQSLTVIAPEGVAVYRDKTKKEVLKILPKGSNIVLVALEGDMYSVTIDGDEGFVEAEAVEIK